MRSVPRPPVDGGTVVVTGASAGIGREFAVQLAPRVATLVLLARRVARLQELRAELVARHPGLTVLVLSVDLSDEQDVQRVLGEIRERVGDVDVLVNNAGVGDSALFEDAEWSRTRAVLATNVLALARLTAGLVPGMVARGRGGVLNVGSGAGLTVLPAAAAYSGSKHFVDGFTEGLRADLAGTGVVVTQVCPGPVSSEFDQLAGSVGGMSGGPPQWLRISPAQCAREALAGFDRGAALVLPGRGYRLLMRLLPLLPRAAQRRQAAHAAARLRSGTATDPARPAVTDLARPAVTEPTRPAVTEPTRPAAQDARGHGRGGDRGRDDHRDDRDDRDDRARGARLSRLVLTAAAVGTVLGTARADLNRTHVFNPHWPPHARFHNVAGWGTVTGAQLLALWLLWRPAATGVEDDLAAKTAALLPAAAWAPFFLALITPGAAVEDEPGHLPRVAGVPLNLVPATLVPAVAALGYGLHRRGL